MKVGGWRQTKVGSRDKRAKDEGKRSEAHDERTKKKRRG